MSNANVTPPVTPPEVEVEVRSTAVPPSSTLAMAEGGREELIQALTDRGVRPDLALSLVAQHSPKQVRDAIEYFEAQRDATPGLLVFAVRQARSVPRRRLDIGRERKYGEAITDWLNENFVELREPCGNAHPAAVTAVIRLHYLEGKGSLTKDKHGPVILGAVKAWNERREAQSTTTTEGAHP